MSETATTDVQDPPFTYFKEWTCIFPGKMGLSWKRAWDGVGTKEEAEAEALKHCNVAAVPLQLFEHLKNCERRMVVAERQLRKQYVETHNILKEADEQDP